MKKYEIMFIVRPDLEEAASASVIENVKNIFADKEATILEEKVMGQKELAYEIKKYKTGFYFYFVIECANADAINEFDRIALISEDIIRHLIVRI